MSGTLTIKGRLLEVQRAVVMLHAGIVALEHEQDSDAAINPAEIAEALKRTTEAANEHLYWLSVLPESVLALPALDDDEANEEAGAPLETRAEETASNRRQLVERAFRHHLLPMPTPATKGRKKAKR